MTRKEMAQALYDAELASDADAIIEAENEICAELDIPLDWTEQGLNIKAENIIRTFMRDQGFNVRPTWSDPA